MELSKLAQSRVDALTHTISADVDGQTLNAVIRPGGVSAATQVRLANAPDADNITSPEQLAELVRIMTRVLCEIVVSWDVQMNGENVPLTDEALQELPGDVLGVLFSAVMEQVGSAPKETSARSKRSTQRAAKRTANS